MKEIKKKSNRILEIEKKYNTNIEELMRRMFVDEELTQHEIKDRLGVAYQTVIRWLHASGVYHRRIDI